MVVLWDSRQDGSQGLGSTNESSLARRIYRWVQVLGDQGIVIIEPESFFAL